MTSGQPTNTTKPLVYISVLNWYNYQQTINCLYQLEKLDYEPKTIIVVDNASPNDSVAHIRAAFPHLRIIQAKENLGYAAGHRHTVDAALAEGAELVWLINTDITFGPNVLSELVLAYLEYGDAIYGSVILKEEDPTVVGMNAYAVDDHGLPDFGTRLIRSRLPFEA